MNRNVELMKYHFKIYMKSNKYIMPLAIVLIFLRFFYSMIPVSVVDTFTISAVILFYIMIWIGLSYHEVEDAVTEQLLILKIGNEKKYYLSKVGFLMIVAGTLSFLMVIYPVISNVINDFNVYLRPLTPTDIIVSFILHCFAAFTGSMTGSFLHPRIMKDRKIAILITFFTAIMSLVKISINDKVPLTQFITWIFPPVSDFIKMFTGVNYYNPYRVGVTLLLFGGYSLVLVLLQIYLLIKNKF